MKRIDIEKGTHNLKINMYFIIGLVLLMEKHRFANAMVDGEDPGVIERVQKLPECKNKKPPSYACRKQILKLVQQDGKTISTTVPSPECCSQLRTWGSDCYNIWIGFDNAIDYMVFGSSDEVWINSYDMWVACK
ncbi:unnamed protein product [Cuscuta europaea]|uniref:Prolamin-like domain-containing protein n=1 Tax=Cuscuta europaea TaxID=41803 RepID=A0A9P0YQH9_CUSEU|nr:unnamed protein product [Cuscuta europaea]